MTKFEVTDDVLDVAEIAYDDHCEDFDTEAQDALDMHASAMRAAITAAIEASRLVERLDSCESRLWAVLHRDDGQDYKEGRRYLERHRPDLAARLDAHESEAAEFLAALNKEPTNDADFTPRKLPDPNIAQMKGWKYQVDWVDQGNVCFYRAKSLLEAEAWADTHLQNQRHYIREIPHDQ